MLNLSRDDLPPRVLVEDDEPANRALMEAEQSQLSLHQAEGRPGRRDLGRREGAGEDEAARHVDEELAQPVAARD